MRKPILAFGVVAALGLLGVGVYYMIARSKSHEELAQILAELDANDPGWRLDDLDRVRLAVPAEENSGPLILKLHGKLPAKWQVDDSESQWQDLWPNEPLPPADAAKFAQRMAKVADVVIDARRIADKPRGCFAITWTPDSVSTVLPHVQQVREMATLLYQDMAWQAHHGKLTLALDSCRACLSVGRSIETEPILISQMVRAACLRNALAGLHRTLAAGEADDASLLAVQKMLAEMDKHNGIVLALRGERASLHNLCTNLENGTVSSRVLLGLMGAPGGRPTISDRFEEIQISSSLPASHVWLIRHLTDAAAACQLPAAEQDARVKEITPRGVNMPAFARIITPAWERCHASFRVNRAQLRCAMAALAVERYRLKHGRWPEDLAALVPEFISTVPADPFTDEPLKFHKAPAGISVYSVGPNRTLKGEFYDRRRPDDPGAVAPAGPPSREGELEFRLWNTDARLR